MTISEVIKKISDEGAQLIRPRDAICLKGEVIKYDVKPLFSGNKKGWVILDGFTASAMLVTYNALSEQNRKRYDAVPLSRLIDFTWKNVK